MSVLETIYVAELDAKVGDFSGNVALIIAATRFALSNGQEIVVTPELSLCGYPPEDLVTQPDFLRAAEQALLNLQHQLATLSLRAGVNQLRVFIGTVVPLKTRTITSPSVRSVRVSNAYLELLVRPLKVGSGQAVNQVQVVRQYCKRDLPSYHVFDEQRNFISGLELDQDFMSEQADARIAVAICEDIWNGVPLNIPPTAQILLVPNASPFEVGKVRRRKLAVENVSKTYNLPVLYFNCQGAQDELVFDKCLLKSDACGRIIEQPKSVRFEEQMYLSIVTSLRAYVVKNGFTSCVLGLSGGIDSAVVATIAVDVLGAQNVIPIAMPSPYSSVSSVADAQDLADNLGCQLRTQPIDGILASYLKQLPENGLELSSVAVENLQARIRANIIMAYSNSASEPCLALATGNKSELAIGYSTIYGDAVGGFAPIKDVLKSEVWELAKWRNSLDKSELERFGFQSTVTNPIPVSSIEKPPSAELRPNQLDQDTLPEYYELDATICQIMQIHYPEIEQVQLVQVTPELKQHAQALVKLAQWKRTQYPLGPKLSQCAFGKDWRYPISYSSYSQN